MEEHAVTPAAHQKGNGFIHAVMLNPMAVVGPKHDLLPPLVEMGEGLPASVDFFIVGQAESGGELTAIFGGGALETKGEGIGVAQASIVLEVDGFGEKLSVRVPDLQGPGIFHDRDRPSL